MNNGTEARIEDYMRIELISASLESDNYRLYIRRPSFFPSFLVAESARGKSDGRREVKFMEINVDVKLIEIN